MANASLPLSLSPLPLSSSFLNPKRRFLSNTRNSSISLTSPTLTSKGALHYNNLSLEIPLKIWKISAVSGDALPLEASPIEQIVVPSDDDGASTIISVLLFLAFVGLSILTIGVIYIAVTDFLTKREATKFEKEEAARKKKNSKKKKGRAKSGPRGFGQRVVEEEDYY